MSSSENFEAGSEARAGRRDACGLGRVCPEGLPGSAVRHIQLPLSVPPHRSGLSEETHQGDLRDTRPLRLSSCLSHPAPGGLGRERQEGL